MRSCLGPSHDGRGESVSQGTWLFQPWAVFTSESGPCFPFSYPPAAVHALSHVQLFVTPWTTARQASLSITNSWRLLKLMSIKFVMPSNRLILCHVLLLSPSIFPSIGVFSNESVLRIRWPKYWCFGFNVSPSNGQPGLISFRMDWLDLLAVQGTLKSLFQHHSLKASVLRCSAFFLSNTHIHTRLLEKPKL